MKRILLALMISASSISVFAQDNGVPAEYTLGQAADYAKYERNVLQCIDWLMATPYLSQPEQDNKASAFLVTWISGSPEITVELNSKIANFIEVNPNLMLVFMAGWTKYALQSRKFDDKLNGTLKGIESVIAYYQKNKDRLQKDRHVDDYIEMQKKNTLVAYIKTNIE
jgi:hypothetical protein